MSEEKSKLTEAIDQLALQTIMVEPEDMMVLGSILESLETIEKMSIDPPLKPIQLLGGSLKKIVEKIILNEFSVPQDGIELLGRGGKLLQNKMSLPDLTSPLPD